MFKWEDGVKISNAKVNEDKTITPAEYEGNTPLTAYNLNLAQQELIKTIYPIRKYIFKC